MAVTTLALRSAVGPCTSSVRAVAAAPAAARTPRKALNDKVIAVLPFVNISPDKESDYFSDGLTEDLISNLSRLKGMSVVSRTNSIRYKGSKLDIEEIGQELGVPVVPIAGIDHRTAGQRENVLAILRRVPQQIGIVVEKLYGEMQACWAWAVVAASTASSRLTSAATRSGVQAVSAAAS